jgi:succinylglutamate desuccinylase
MLFLHSGLHANEVSPIKMVDQLHADRTDNAA